MPDAPRRFFERAGLEPEPGGFALRLDGRPARTPGRNGLVLPTRALGEAVAAEWNGQGATIDPRTMPLTRLANSALDGVSQRLGEVLDDVARYAGSDLVLYRAGAPDRLVAAQAAGWDPVLAWAREEHGWRFVLSEGVTFVAQPPETLRSIRDRIAAEFPPFAAAALHVMTTLTGSALVPLTHAAGRIGVGEAWRAAHVDELFQESLWGEDLEARQRRDAREAEFQAASRFLALARSTGPAV